MLDIMSSELLVCRMDLEVPYVLQEWAAGDHETIGAASMTQNTYGIVALIGPLLPSLVLHSPSLSHTSTPFAFSCSLI